MGNRHREHCIRMTHQTIILQVQGGMGNQMIQYGFLQAHLSETERCKVIINPIMTSKLWAKVRGVSHRPLSKLLKSHYPIIKSKRKQIYDWLESKKLPKGHSILNDQDKGIPDNAQVIHCSGYFQRHQAFSEDSNPVWHTILNSLQKAEQKDNYLYPTGKVALHHRLGDYLWKENQRLFAQISLKERIGKALNWRESLGNNEPVAIFTDSPDLLREQMNKELSAVEIKECIINTNTTALHDFEQISRHRHIVAGCSTFALCAGRVAWQRLRELDSTHDNPTVELPLRWYQDEIKNETMMTEMSKCKFTNLSKQLRIT